MGRVYHDDLNQKLFENFPELKPIADSKLEYFGEEEPGPHVIYNDVLVPKLRRTDVEEDVQFLQKAFDLLEMLAQHPHRSHANDVLLATVLPAILSPRERDREELEEVCEWLQKVRKQFMGEETLRWARIVANDSGWGREKVLQALGGGPSASSTGS